jgi:hypothetical protein
VLYQEDLERVLRMHGTLFDDLQSKAKEFRKYKINFLKEEAKVGPQLIKYPPVGRTSKSEDTKNASLIKAMDGGSMDQITNLSSKDQITNISSKDQIRKSTPQPKDQIRKSNPQPKDQIRKSNPQPKDQI